jgi:predicted kinase
MKLILITGPAGAGKSTRAQELMKERDIRYNFEADQWMKDEQGNYCFNPKKLYYFHKKCQDYAESVMKLKQDLIISNTTLTMKEARPYIDLAKIYNYEVEIIHLTTQFQNLHGVPEEKVKQMQNKREFFRLEDFA